MLTTNNLRKKSGKIYLVGGEGSAAKVEAHSKNKQRGKKKPCGIT